MTDRLAPMEHKATDSRQAQTGCCHEVFTERSTLFYDRDAQTTDVSENGPLESLQSWHKDMRL